jgi:hypothetical protein
VLLAAVIHGAGNLWIGAYIDVYRDHFGGVVAFTAVMAVVSLAIVWWAGPENLSRTNRRNVVAS